MSEWRKLKQEQVQFPILAISKRCLSSQERKQINKNSLESDSLDSAMSQENALHQYSHLEKL